MITKRRSLILVFALISIAAVIAVLGPSMKRQIESTNCGNYMASIGIAARLWANDNADQHLPSDLLSMSDELSSTKILICPGDHSRLPAPSWDSFTTNNSSYEIVTPGLKEGDTNTVFLRCKIHGHLGYADGTVFDGVRRRTKIP